MHYDGKPRVWACLSFIDQWRDSREQEELLLKLDSKGVRLESFHAPNSDLYLYDLSGKL